jgi:hypothetical protein
MFQLKWKKNAVPGKPLKRKLPGIDEEKHEKNKRYEEHRLERKLNTKWQEGRDKSIVIAEIGCWKKYCLRESL